MADFSRDFGRAITHLNRLRRRYMADKLRDEGVGGSLYSYLLALDRSPGASQDFLANWFFMDKGNVARSAKKLEELGFIRREVSPDDRRQNCLFLTDKGTALVPVIRHHLTEWTAVATEGLTDDEKHTLIELFDRMEGNINSRGGE